MTIYRGALLECTDLDASLLDAKTIEPMQRVEQTILHLQTRKGCPDIFIDQGVGA
jgi:hypothetical protein